MERVKSGHRRIHESNLDIEEHKKKKLISVLFIGMLPRIRIIQLGIENYPVMH